MEVVYRAARGQQNNTLNAIQCGLNLTIHFLRTKIWTAWISSARLRLRSATEVWIPRL